MSRETEKVFKELNKAMEEKEFENEEQAKKFMDEFITNYNMNLKTEKKLDSYDYLEKAENAVTIEETIKYAKKALKLDPYCLDAEYLIAQSEAENIDVLLIKMEKIIRKGEAQLKERRISMEEDAGSFYGLLGTRPYMRIRKGYLELLLEMGRFRMAIGEAEELLRLSENDNLGVRYSLMALYCFFEEEGNALNLFSRYEEESAFMFLPLIALYYKMGNVKKMRKYIKRLANRNSDLQNAIEMMMDADQEEALSNVANSEMYRPFSTEEVILAFTEGSYLYIPMRYFLPKLYEEVVS